MHTCISQNHDQAECDSDTTVLGQREPSQEGCTDERVTERDSERERETDRQRKGRSGKRQRDGEGWNVSTVYKRGSEMTSRKEGQSNTVFAGIKKQTKWKYAMETRVIGACQISREGQTGDLSVSLHTTQPL